MNLFSPSPAKSPAKVLSQLLAGLLLYSTAIAHAETNLTDLPAPVLRKIQTYLSTRDNVNLVQASTQSNPAFHANLTSKYTYLNAKKYLPALDAIQSYDDYLRVRHLGLFDLSELRVDLTDQQGWAESKKFFSDIIARRDTRTLSLFPRSFTGLNLGAKGMGFQEERLARGWQNLDRLVLHIPCELTEGLERQLLWAEALLRQNSTTLTGIQIVVEPTLRLQPTVTDEQYAHFQGVLAKFFESVRGLTHLNELGIETLDAGGPGGFGRGARIQGLWSQWYQLSNYLNRGAGDSQTQLRALILKNFLFSKDRELLNVLSNNRQSLERVELNSHDNDHILDLNEELANLLGSLGQLKHLALEHFYARELSPEAAALLKPEQPRSAFVRLLSLTQLESLSIKTWLGIRPMPVDSEIAELLLPLIRNNPQLRELTLISLHLNQFLAPPNGPVAEDQALAQWNFTFARLDKLEVLNLSSSSLERPEIHRILPSLALLPSLRSLDLSYNRDLAQFPSIIEELKPDAFRSLTELKLVCDGVFWSNQERRALNYDESILSWFDNSPLQSVLLSDGDRNRTPGNETFLTLLSSFFEIHSRTLHLAGFPQFRDSAETLLRAILKGRQRPWLPSPLKSLTLQINELPLQLLGLAQKANFKSELQEYLLNSLESLDLRGIKLDLSDAKELVALIPPGFPSIRLTIAHSEPRSLSRDKAAVEELRRELAKKHVLYVDLGLHK